MASVDSGKRPQDYILGNFQPSLRDCSFAYSTQDYVLGYSQPSLRDSIWRGSSHATCEARTYPGSDVSCGP